MVLKLIIMTMHLTIDMNKTIIDMHIMMIIIINRNNTLQFMTIMKDTNKFKKITINLMYTIKRGIMPLLSSLLRYTKVSMNQFLSREGP